MRTPWFWQTRVKERDYAENSKLEIAAKAQPCSKLASSWPWPSPGSHFASEGGSSLGTYVCLWEAELQTQGLGPGSPQTRQLWDLVTKAEVGDGLQRSPGRLDT